MKRPITLAAGCLAVLTPDVASAALELRFGQPELQPGAPGMYEVDVYATPVGNDNDDEQLFAYDVGFLFVRSAPSSQPPAFSFAAPYAEKPADSFVFGDRPVDFRVASSPAPGPDRFLLSVEAQTTEDFPDVTGPVKIARVLVEASGAVPDTFYYLRFDPALTQFLSGDPTRVDSNIEVNTDDQVVFFPEPSAGVLTLGAAALVLRRRRRAVR